MKEQRLKILQKVANGELTPEQADTELLGLSIVGSMLPTDEELDNAAIDFVNRHCDNVSSDLTQETECFDAGAIWMRERLLGHYC